MPNELCLLRVPVDGAVPVSSEVSDRSSIMCAATVPVLHPTGPAGPGGLWLALKRCWGYTGC